MCTPFVSIKTITYNHVNYIEQCIEGVLMQRTNFKFELVIGEDFSLDGTREIVKKYAKKYPNIIKLVISNSNVGADENSRRTQDACVGKYIAFCEGDDYWTDPYKLQKQVDFLESNPDFGLVHTAYSKFIQTKGLLVKTKYKKVPTGDIFNVLLRGLNSISTLSVLVRADALKKSKNLFNKDQNESWKMGDLPLWIGIAKYYKVGYISDNTAVYRVLNESASHSNESDKVITFYKSGFEIRRWFCYKFNLECFLDEIDENELYFLYYKTFLGDMSENEVYKEKITKNKIQYRSYWKTLMKLTAESKMFSYFFKKIYVVIYK